MVSTAIHTKENLQGKDVTITDAKNARRAKVSAWIYYRQLFAKKEILQYKEMIEISRWRLDRSHPYGLWFIYWDPPKIQTSYIKRTGGNTKLSKEILFLIRGVLKTALQEGILVKPRTLSRTYQRGKNPPHDFLSVFPMIFCARNVFFRILRNLFGKNIDVDRLLWLLDTTSSLAWSQFIFNKNAFFFHN